MRGATIDRPDHGTFRATARVPSRVAAHTSNTAERSRLTVATEQVDTVVVGAGVVGLACAAALARAGRQVIVLEAESAVGTATSSRNSEVVHAGLYYPPGSLKARLCVAGRQLLYAYCSRRQVTHRRCGKLVVAADASEVDALSRLAVQAQRNGVDDLQWLSRAEAQAMEPALACEAALWSPSTGIVDSHGLMQALLAEAEGHGAVLALRSPVLGGRVTAGAIELDVDDLTLRARRVVNAAGLQACALARLIGGVPDHALPTAYFAQGAYFGLVGRAPFSRLIYPVPGVSGHLGVHLTLDLGGQARFGPSLRWVDDIDYRIDPADGAAFAESVRRYWPGLPEGALQPDYAGIRPKISGPGQPAADFRIDGPAQHGVAGLVHLFGIESPGLTAALAIVAEVEGRLRS